MSSVQEAPFGQSPNFITVDEHVPQRNLYELCKEFGAIFSKTFCLASNKKFKNAFCIVQLLDKTESAEYFMFVREGQIGETGTQRMTPFGHDVGEAVEKFNSFCETKVKVEKYQEIEIVCDDPSISQDQIVKVKQLSPPLLRLLHELFGNKTPDQIAQVGYNLKVLLPLGKLSPGQLKKAKDTLGLMVREYANPEGGDKLKLAELNDDFYSQVPHNLLGRSITEFVLKTRTEVASKLELIELLTILQGQPTPSPEALKHLTEEQRWYLRMNNEINALDPASDDYKMVEKYFETSKDYLQYKLLHVYSLKREIEHKRFRKSLWNRMLLWHGSNIEFFGSILATGLRVPPPDVSRGSLFGKGVYFADMVGKAGAYCAFNKNGVGAMLLCEVALGDEDRFLKPNYISNLPSGTHSAMGLGLRGPNPKNEIEHKDGYRVPFGPAEKSVYTYSSLGLNEYIVYKTDQIKQRFLILMTMK